MVCRLQSCVVNTRGCVSLFSSMARLEKDLHSLFTGGQAKLPGRIIGILIKVLCILFCMHNDYSTHRKEQVPRPRLYDLSFSTEALGAAGEKVTLGILLLFHLLMLLLHWKNIVLVIMYDLQIISYLRVTQP